ncbi:MAG: hypothetical protein IPM60_14525 [Rhodospirillales bacterium]|nr:hypothetical protein [Rhodospirillales bacterium]
MYHDYTYESALAASHRASWRIEDIIGEGKHLDFGKPFLPESLARVQPLTFLSPEEQRTLNQIRGNAYLTIFGLVEEFILPFVLDHARPRLHGDDVRTRAFLAFAAEEAKHIHLFKQFRMDFEAGFGTRCDVIGPPQEIAHAVLSHHPLAVALTILHIEWMTQRHYLESVRDNQDLDPQFKSLLRHHWMEEAQHAKLDTLMVEALVETCRPREVADAVNEYLEIGMFLDEGLRQQVTLDMDAFARATGRTLSAEERESFLEVQHQANRWTYIGSAMTHSKFLASLEDIGPEVRSRIEQIAPAFC